MHVRLLGTAAGGGFPQWNCRCPNCIGVRSGALRAKPRSQSSVAISADGQRWLLLNASPDVRTQIESFPPLLAQSGPRGTSIQVIFLTNADLDHTLGLFVLREGNPLIVYATLAVRRALTGGLNLTAALDQYCGIEWREPPASEIIHGLQCSTFHLPGKPPRYSNSQEKTGWTVAFRFVDPRTGGRLIYMPELAALDPRAIEALNDCDLLLLDGTFWSDDEMKNAGVGETTAKQMGHLPIGGDNGSLHVVRNLRNVRTIYVHINNTNPILNEDSPEHKKIIDAGAEVGYDGKDFDL